MAESMRDALVEAYAKHSAEVEETPATPETPAPEAPASETPSAEKIESSAAPEATTPPVKDGGEQSPPAAAAPLQTAAVQPATEPAKIAPAKPPRSWSAEAKAAFAALPEPVKNDVLRREKEISQGLENAAPARKHYESFQEVVKPFQPLFDAYGVRDPLPAIKELLTARATLEIGSPEQKAQFLANLVHEFGVDVAALDAFLVKRGPVAPFQPARPMPAPQRDPEVQALLDQFKQARLEKAEAAVAAVESLPHFEDLREDMADVIESSPSPVRQSLLRPRTSAPAQ